MILALLHQNKINHILITINLEEIILFLPPRPSIAEPLSINIHLILGINIKFLFKNLFMDINMKKESILGQEVIQLQDLKKVLKNRLTDIPTPTSLNKISSKQRKYISETTHMTQIQVNTNIAADHLETTTKTEE